ncbi:MAG: NUDIX hydrolase [Nitriliruptoraceae bacterium]
MNSSTDPTQPPGAAWFETLAVEERYAGFSRVVVERVKTPTGAIVDREIVDHTDAVAVVAVTDDDEVVLLRQYRQPVREYLLEVPAGKLDVPGEPPHEAGLRELAEEAHHTAASLIPLTVFLNSAGWCTERTHVFLAIGARPDGPPRGFVAEAEEADMEVVMVPLADAVAMARSGALPDVKTALGLLLADAYFAQRDVSSG